MVFFSFHTIIAVVVLLIAMLFGDVGLITTLILLVAFTVLDIQQQR